MLPPRALHTKEALLIIASELAGFFAAHAIWSVSEGETLTPMLAHQSGDERQMTRLAYDELAEAVEAGQRSLEENATDADDAALVYDGFITINGEKLDAVIAELRAYFSPDSKAILAVPYTPRRSGAFRVHKPKLLQWDACEDFDLDVVIGAFFRRPREA
jgi:hypothetical protein